MTVNFQIKGMLAKLLATEDIVVEHRAVETACFDVQNRVLTLPIWEKAGNKVYDLLVSHECGHAIFTPNEDWREKLNVPMQFLNVTEDVRIEKMMKRKFAGLSKTFYAGYNVLHSEDFFSIGDDDISEYNLADRINLHYKIGAFSMIPFSDEEKAIVKMVGDSETFDDALKAAEILYEYCKNQMKDQLDSSEDISTKNTVSLPGNSPTQSSPSDQSQPSDMETEDGTSSDHNQDTNQTETGNVDDGVEEQQEGGGGQGAVGSNNHSPEPTVKTQDAVNEKVKDLTTNFKYNEPTYFNVPKGIYLDNLIASNEEVHDEIEKTFAAYNKALEGLDPSDNVLSAVSRDWDAFYKNIQPEVNYIVKEFECKKSANAYSRTSQSKTGVLDCTKLHTFKYNDDLFKKVTNLPEGKNHGLIFVLDWSGSMDSVLLDTTKQLLSLAMFCSKVNIPYEVYAFTHEWNYHAKVKKGHSNENEVASHNTGDMYFDDTFTMMNLLSSKGNRKEQLKQMKNFFIVSSALTRNHYNSVVPAKLGLSGTPLDEAIASLHAIIPFFQKKHNVEKLSITILTDGEAAPARIYGERELNNKHVYRRPPIRGIGGHNTYMRNRKTGTVTPVTYERGYLTRVLIEDLLETFPNITVTGFRLVDRGTPHILRSTMDQKLMNEWKKTKCATIKDHGYNNLFVIATSEMNNSSEFDVHENATKAKIKSAFAKSLKAKKVNKKILSEFVTTIS